MSFFDSDNLTDADISGRFIESLESGTSATIIRVGHILALMVAKEYRRRGIATRILAEAKIYFRRQGINDYTFYRAVTNQAAIRLYDKTGMAAPYIIYWRDVKLGNIPLIILYVRNNQSTGDPIFNDKATQ